MVEIDPGLDTRLRAFFDHYECEAMPSRLATFDQEAKPKGSTAIQFVAGAVAVAVIAAAVAVFAIELNNHKHATQSGLPRVGASPPLPAGNETFTSPLGSKTLVPATKGTGKSTLPTFTPTDRSLYVLAFCTGGGSMVITSQPAEGGFPDSSPCLGGVFIEEFGRDELMSGPLSLSVNAPASSRWQILVYETDQLSESASATPSALPAAFDTFTAPPGSKTLVPATKGTGTVTLPTFVPTEWYYIVSTCTGGGSMVISSQPAEGGPGSSSCLSSGADDFLGPADEVMGEPITLTVSAPASASWEILVYETNQPGGA